MYVIVYYIVVSGHSKLVLTEQSIVYRRFNKCAHIQLYLNLNEL